MYTRHSLSIFEKINSNDLLCPVCKTSFLSGVLTKDVLCRNSSCKGFEIAIELVNGKPVLIDFEESIVKKDYIFRHQGMSMVRRTKSNLKQVVSKVFGERNLYTRKNVKCLETRLSEIKSPKILIIGGGEIGSGLREFYEKFGHAILAFDIYDSPHTDFIADAHNIPVRDNFFDVVIIQAVLEHVLNPTLVVMELTRVLKNEGIVYAETPFMQHVHEGAFDFTRFTESGHRFLFWNYECLDSGYTKGVGTSLIWALDFFFSGLFRSRTVGKGIRIFFFWLRFFDKIIPYSYNIDGACGVFFLGRKKLEKKQLNEIVNYYQGSQR